MIHVLADDFEEIKQDISSFRYEILNHLKLRETAQNEITLAIKSMAEDLKVLTTRDMGPLDRLQTRGGSVREKLPTRWDRIRKEELKNEKSPEENEKKEI